MNPAAAQTVGGDREALAFQSVSKAFDADGRRVEALCDVSLQIPSGAVSGLIGPDGAGKTTLMRLAAGLLLPDTGRVSVFGLDTEQRLAQIHQCIGYMPQRFGLYEELSVEENLVLYADLHGLRDDEREERFRELTRMTGLAPFSARLANRLSGGMKQKLGLACTLVSRPRLLLLDEPTVGVDPVSRRELWTIITRLVEEESVTVLLSTAYLDESERCRHVILLDRGRVVEQGSPEAFKARMKGRCFNAAAPDRSRRELHAQLGGSKELVDAVIHGGRVRIVTRKPSSAAALAPCLPGTPQVEATPPRVEDAFVALLRGERSEQTQPSPQGPRKQSLPTERVIEVERAERRFGAFVAVDRISFSVKRGEVFGLLGANGAGKTTTFRMLCGLLPASGGRLRVAGVDLRRAPAKARAKIGYMSQKFSLYGHLSIMQNLEFFGRTYGLARPERARRIDAALNEYALAPMADSPAMNLPLGYKQRLAMACALLHGPEILFLDEPTSGVDPLARREFWHRTNALAQAGVTVLVTTHFMEEAEYCDRLVIMAAGAILAAGTPDDIKERVKAPELPEPTMEEAFIRLVESSTEERQP